MHVGDAKIEILLIDINLGMWNINVGGYTEYAVVYAHNVLDI